MVDFDYVIVGAGAVGCVLANRLFWGPGQPGAPAGARRRGHEPQCSRAIWAVPD